MRYKHPHISAVVVMLVAMLGVQTRAIPADSSTFVPKQATAPSNQPAITSAAVKILRHIAQARGLLNVDGEERIDTSGAIDELKQADKLLDTIRESLPTTKLKDRIWIASKHLEYEKSKEVLQDMAPIFLSLDELVDYLPTEKSHQHLEKARKALEAGRKNEALEQLRAAGDSLVYIEAELPMKTTRRLVHNAWQNLQSDDFAKADEALSDAEENVVFISTAFQSPLIEAKAAIARSRRDYKFGDRKAAGNDLAEATGYLQKATEGSDKVARKAVSVLISRLHRLENALAAGDVHFDQDLMAVWHRIEALSERTAELVSTEWDKYGANSEVKRNLIEAKLQLAYARIDHVLMHDEAAAKFDLGETDSYLSTARTRADIDIEKQLQALSLELARLETSLGKPLRADASAGYYALESEMTHLIATL